MLYMVIDYRLLFGMENKMKNKGYRAAANHLGNLAEKIAWHSADLVDATDVKDQNRHLSRIVSLMQEVERYGAIGAAIAKDEILELDANA